MKALSTQQPYAFAIVMGFKPVENRTWKHSHRGPTLIHTGKKELVDDICGALRMIAKQHKVPLATIESGYRSHHFLGGFVGAVTITDCVSDHESHWFNGPYAFVLERPQWAPCPLAWRGERGFFDVPKAALDQLYLPSYGLNLGLHRDPAKAQPELL